MSQCNDRLDDLPVLPTAELDRNERSVDLQRVEGVTMEATQRRVSRTEIVDCQTSACRFQRREESCHVLCIADDRIFGEGPNLDHRAAA